MEELHSQEMQKRKEMQIRYLVLIGLLIYFKSGLDTCDQMFYIFIFYNRQEEERRRREEELLRKREMEEQMRRQREENYRMGNFIDVSYIFF